MKRRYVLKNKRRFTAIITLFLMISIFAGLIITVEATSGEPFLASYEKVTVQKGDTLWEIALRLNKKGDPRVIIYKIKKLNNLESCYIYEGQELLIP